MKISCGYCKAVYSIDDSYRQRERLKVRCPSCGKIQEINNLQLFGMGDREPCQPLDNGLLDCGPKSRGGESKEWKVKKADGLEEGPFDLCEIKHRIRQGRVDRDDFLAKGDSEYLSLDHWAGLEPFSIKTMTTTTQTDLQSIPGQKDTEGRPRNRVQSYLIVALVVSIILVVALFVVIQPNSPETRKKINDFNKIIEKFAQEIPAPTGDIAKLIQTGKELMWLDTGFGYLQADKAFKSALIMDSTNQTACSGWVQNRALMDRGKGEVTLRKMAMDMIEMCIHREPQNPLLHRAKAYLLYSLGETSKARTWAEKAFSQAPKDSETLLILGAACLDTDTDKAISSVKQALIDQSQLLIAYHVLGQALALQGRYNAAVDVYQQRLERQPGNLDTLEALAGIALEIGDLKLAESTYLQILDIDAFHVSSLVQLARMHIQSHHRYRPAANLIEKALRDASHLSPSDKARLLCEKSVLLRLEGSLEKALEAAGQAVFEDPYYIPAMYSRAVTQLDAGQLVKALTSLKELKNHLPRSARVRARLAEAYMLVPDYDASQRELSEAIDLDSEDLDILLMRAVMHMYLDNRAQSQKWMQRALETKSVGQGLGKDLNAYYDGPSFLKNTVSRAKQTAEKYDEDAYVRSLWGISLLRAGKVGMARKVLIEALQKKADCFQANLYLGLLNLSDGNYLRAVFFLEAAYRKNALHLNTAVGLAEAYLKNGWIKKAETIFASNAQKGQKHIGIQLGLAKVSLAKKQKKRAVEQLVNLVRWDRENMIAKRMLFQLGY